MKITRQKIFSLLLILYVAALFCGALLLRESLGRNAIQSGWFWGYRTADHDILYRDNLLNILLYLPIGFLVASLVPRYKWLAALLAGLLLSETIECSQLIWQRGVFDVDDLFNNTVGAFLGGLVALLASLFPPKGKSPKTDTP